MVAFSTLLSYGFGPRLEGRGVSKPSNNPGVPGTVLGLSDDRKNEVASARATRNPRPGSGVLLLSLHSVPRYRV